MKTFVNLVHLVTTKDGKCPDGYVEVETVLEAPMLRDLLRRAQEQDEVHWKTRRSLLICIEELHETLEGLYRDNIDYLTLNNLGGYDNHWLVMARKVLKLPCSAAQRQGKQE
jgi:hypothetical protein